MFNSIKYAVNLANSGMFFLFVFNISTFVFQPSSLAFYQDFTIMGWI